MLGANPFACAYLGQGYAGSTAASVTGAAAQTETVTLTAAGVRTALGAATRSETLSFVASGIRKALGFAAQSETLTFTAVGVRTTFGAAARSETLTFTAAGVVSSGVIVYGAADMPLTCTLTASGFILFPAGDTGSLSQLADGVLTYATAGRLTKATHR